MLSSEALEKSMPLTQMLDARGIALQAKEGSPLAALVRATRTSDRFNTGEGADLSPDVENILYMTNCKDPLTQSCDHDVVMDDVVQVVIEAVQGQVLFAKSVVSPVVQELVERTNQELAAFSVSELLGMEVVTYALPKPLGNSTLESTVRRFSEIAFDVPPLGMRLPDQTAAEIVGLMASGGSGLDKDVQEWIASKGESFVITVWQAIFQQTPYDDAAPSRTFRDWIENREDGCDWALAIFLLSRKLLDAPPEGTSMPLSRYTSLMEQFRDQSAARLARAFEELERITATGMLVRKIDGKKTIVNAGVYRAWIEAGGENEVLFGNMLRAPGFSTVSQINAEAAGLKAAWQRHVGLLTTAESNRKFARTKEILERVFTSQLAKLSEDDATTVGNNYGVRKLFVEQLEQLGENDLVDLYATALRLVCRSRFVHTSAEKILAGIERVKRENPTVSVREAAAVSLIDYISEWVGKQLLPVGV